MKCPSCSATLLMTDRLGIEIDYCPECRGVWLDRGELDKIIEKSNNENDSASNKPEYRPDYKTEKKYYDNENDYKYGKRKKGLLGELFDF